MVLLLNLGDILKERIDLSDDVSQICVPPGLPKICCSEFLFSHETYKISVWACQEIKVF